MKTNSLDFDAQALREKILDLAMRGKLVKQDPNDEPASVLLKKIKAEKEELVKEGKIKKSKALPEIADDEKPFDIPDSWEWVRLGDIGEIFAGGDKPKTFSKTKDKYHTVPIYSNGVENKGLYGFTNKARVYNPAITLSARGTIGHVEYRKKPYLPIIRLISFVPYNEEYLNCIFYFLQSEKLIEKGDGSSIPQLTVPKLKPKLIPLPPLEEQSRIAAKIAQLFALLRKVESSTQQYAKLQALLKSKVLDLAMRGKLVNQDPNDEPASVLLEKIKAEKEQLIKEKKIKKSKPLPPISDEEKPFEIPDSWEWVRLGEVLDVRDGTHDTPKYVNSGIPLITAKNLKHGSIDFTNIKYISLKDAKKINERSKVDIEDILFAMIGTIGNPVLVTTDTDFAIKNVALLKATHYLNMSFVCKYIQSAEYLLVKNSSGGNQKFISLKKIKEIPLVLPPIKIQNKIVEQIGKINDYIYKL
jgi:type I restriction enzyme S subunit